MNGVVVVIPARNEMFTVAAIVRKAREAGCRVVVVDDASDDDTAALADVAGAEVIRLRRHSGNLRAIQVGMAFALRSMPQWIVTMDADGQHSPDDIERLVNEARRADVVVVGSCVARASRLRHMAWKWFRLISGLEVRDMTSGFRAYPLAAAVCLRDANARCLLFQDVPVLLLFRLRNFIVKEIPVNMSARQVGASKVFSSWGKVFAYMIWVSGLCLLFRLRRLLG